MTLFGRGPGRWIQEIKDYLLALVLDGELAQDDRARATKLAIAFAKELGIEPAGPAPE
jgi:poly(A) polymerase